MHRDAPRDARDDRDRGDAVFVCVAFTVVGVETKVGRAPVQRGDEDTRKKERRRDEDSVLDLFVVS